MAAGVLGLALMGCGSAVGPTGIDATTAESSTGPSESTTLPEDPTTGPDPTGSTTMTGQRDVGDDANATDISGGFIYGSPDMGTEIECSTWEQDCSKDEKCMPWANDGGNSWNATRCSPLADDPSAVGEPCTAEGSFVSGIDTCERWAVCIGPDLDLLDGVCVEMCSGSPEAPVCDDTDNGTCFGADGVRPLCLPICDPLVAECDEGYACAPAAGPWECIPEGDVPLGEPCDATNACSSPSVCAPPDALCPEGSAGCCASICDLSDPEPDLDCADGQTCMPSYEDGRAYPGYEDVGLCTTVK